jgi:Predicted O-methyltransferase
MSNLPLLREIAGDGIEIEVIYGDALEYLRGIEDGSLDLAFIDIEKGSHPQALRLLRKKLRKEGIAIFHNAISPKPLVPRRSLIVIDINLFVLLCFLIHRGAITSRSHRGTSTSPIGIWISLWAH